MAVCWFTGKQYDVENRLVVANAGDTYSYGVDNLRAWKLKPDGTEELQLYGAHGERLGTYPIWPNPTPTSFRQHLELPT